MAQSFAEALKDAKVIDESVCRDVLAKKNQREQSQLGEKRSHLVSKSNQPVNFDVLETSTTIAEFKNAVKKLLIEFPDQEEELFRLIIPAAHRFKDQPGGNFLIKLVYQTKENLKIVKESFRQNLINRAFRKNGGTYELRREWLTKL